jgi:hypothetical protein
MITSITGIISTKEGKRRQMELTYKNKNVAQVASYTSAVEEL